MTVLEEAPRHVGVLLRHWRESRRMSQLDLATRTEVSARHVSFVETGRSKPTRSMLLKLSEQLEIPHRERNSLLLAGGFAPAYPEHPIDAFPMAAVSDAIAKILDAQLPYPAIVVDRHWNMIDGNAAVELLTAGCAQYLLEPPVNVLRLSLHPDGMAPRIRNLGQWRAHVLDRLTHQINTTGDQQLVALHRELGSYPGSDEPGTHDTRALVVPLTLAGATGDLSFFSTTTVFGTPLDVTLAELAIESFYPADDRTARAFGR
ncbi:helix-turn-helix domain-containing protein [Antrihabitans cavernicola]|uniref:Helix-turn-helix transcriptional regulator n=1 Tax=Antrihabitans cavernicola TaxID=2495913 RepID=A0A5A7S3Q3_9NOCA|nr:helix-turn-helix transcriptional regulator [Spelaeibacter cavernicola]KAA0020031.1 helix-turn-helix transcriptional regulator [Spelaeibacter cavernicola]